MLPTSAGVEPATSWSPVGRRIQLSHRGRQALANNKLFSTKGHGVFDHDLCLQCYLLLSTNVTSKFEGPIPKHCQVIKLFSTECPGELDLCPQDHLLMRSNISTKFKVLKHKHCRITSFFGTKGHGDLDRWLKGHLLFRSILPIGLIVLGLIIANVFFSLYVKQATTRNPNLNTHVKGPLSNITYQIRQRFFKFFSYISASKTRRSWGRAIFGPRAVSSTILVEVHWVKLCIKY